MFKIFPYFRPDGMKPELNKFVRHRIIGVFLQEFSGIVASLFTGGHRASALKVFSDSIDHVKIV